MTTCLRDIERFAAETYTMEIFQDLKKQIEQVGAQNLLRKKRYSKVMLYELVGWVRYRGLVTSHYSHNNSTIMPP
ncbi:hypothetical protein PIB30_091566 [Stylosanthes scabra]|uniref:Uncharacterized protein n=1 Tax=Stylosanthes scabra TaxID=79078 RepID=A0ABU6ZTA2_9FABA|nr:hypothetical protein [Stylosanthes scabra]